MSSLWELDLGSTADLDQYDNRKPGVWTLKQTQGTKPNCPGPVAYHTTCVCKDQMFLFGGNNYVKTITVTDPTNLEEEKIYNPLFSLNLRTWTWSVQKTRSAPGVVIKPRDEHTAVVDEELSLMIIFGGFIEGERTNEIAIYDMKQNKWSVVEQNGHETRPCPRSGHSAVFYQTKRQMYIFGGKDSDSLKLNDLWVFDFQSSTWTQILPTHRKWPEQRSGHSACIYEHNMFIFGGIFEVTKELNDVQAFSLKTKEWTSIYEDEQSPQKLVRRNTILNQGAMKGFGDD